MSIEKPSSTPEKKNQRGPRKLLRLNLGLWHNVLETTSSASSHLLSVPVFTLTTSPEVENGGRKFHFGLRKYSSSTLNRSESMASLCFRSLSTFVLEDNLSGLRNFLDGRNVQIDDRDENGATALMLAAGRPGSVGTALTSELISRGADVCAADLDGWSALLVAARAGHTDTCALLLEHGADIEQRDMGGWTALMWSAYKGHTSTAQLLLSRNADTNAHGNYHISALVWASGRGHLQIVRALIAHGAKINVGDKYGTTALVWACRAGHVEIVRELLMQGANVDTTGMYSWTPLLVATQGNFLEVVNIILEHKPNVNALDKDGCTALTIACKEGFYEIATALLNAGAYINIQDRAGDTNLIHAVKGGHRGIVEALLKKYADVDVCGKDRKTALYTAVEKGNVGIVKLLLGANPDLEIATKDGDTPLLRAVRLRHTDIVQLLLERRARVSAADCRGDTALHVAMRARSRRLVEMLLRDPKHSQLLYRPNKHGETPYNIDLDHQKQILGQVFGARRLNTNEDNENMLGYDLYSSALADMLSEPSLSMPITVGLYARWGSGKSFLLSKLRDEMKNFARQWSEPRFNVSSLLFLALAHIALVLGVVVGVSTKSWLWGLIASVIFLGIVYVILGTLWYLNERYDLDWCYNMKIHINRKLNALRLILQVTFCHPPGPNAQSNIAPPIRFYFTDQTRVSGSAAGENSVVQMLGSLYDAIESSYGALPTRLYRAFRPKPMKSSTSWRLRRLCCVPYAAIFELCLIMLLVGTCALTVYFIRDSNRALADTLSTSESIESVTINVILVTVALLLGVTCIANLYTWGRVLAALVFSQRRQLQRAIARLDTLKSEGFQQALTQEVNLMKDMVKCLDSLSSQQTRLVIIVDGLDSCEQDKVLLVLDAVHMLFSEANSPFIVILAIDPHVISKAVEVNSRRLFNESNIGGHDYLRSLVHLPFYLQNSGLRRVKMAQHAASQQQQIQQQQLQTHSRRQQRNDDDMPGFVRSQSSRRLSTDSALMSSSEKLKPPTYISQTSMNPLPRKSSRKLKASESIASSLGSNLNMVVGAHDLTKMLLTDDYFSDVNPRSMRRLMNVVYVTGRLLKAFQIEFNWYHLASWVNITEQWPYRTSWLVLYLEQQQQYEQHEDEQDGGFVIEDNTPLKVLYDKIRPRIPNQKEVEPLLELDRDEKKFDIFLTFHRSSLQVLDLKIFLPFAINLDPYIKKVIKEEYQQPAPSIAPSINQGSYTPVSNPYYVGTPDWSQQQVTTPRNSFIPYPRPRSQVPITPIPGTVVRGIKVWKNGQMEDELIMDPMSAGMGLFYEGDRIPATTNFPPLEPDLMSTDLASLSVSGVCQLIEGIKDLSPTAVNRYSATIKEHNINGAVLLRCNLNELKEIMNMSFGDWELFRMVIVSLREKQMSLGSEKSESRNEGVRKKKGGSTRGNRSNERDSKNENNSMKQRQNNNHSIMEKQVTLEDQMICGALQTLNEEACEDVLEETVNIIDDDPNPQTKVVVSSSPSDQGFLSQQSNVTDGRTVQSSSRSRTGSASNDETDFVILQTSTFGRLQPLVGNTPEFLAFEAGFSNSANSSVCSTPRARRRADFMNPITTESKNNDQNYITINMNPLSSSDLQQKTSSGTFLKKESQKCSGNSENNNVYTQTSKLGQQPNTTVQAHEYLQRTGSSKNVSISISGKSFRQQRPSSLLVSKDDQISPCSSTSSKNITFRSKSVDDNSSKKQSVKLQTCVKMKFGENLTPTSSLERLSKLKEKLLTNVTTVSECRELSGNMESDDESTPLVSDISTPSVGCTSPSRHFQNGAFSPQSNSNSNKTQSPLSPVSSQQHSSPDIEQKIENTFTDTTDFSPVSPVPPGGGNIFSELKSESQRKFTQSSCDLSLTNILENRKCNQQFLNVSDGESTTSFSGDLRRSSNASSLSRQDALDRDNVQDFFSV